MVEESFASTTTGTDQFPSRKGMMKKAREMLDTQRIANGKPPLGVGMAVMASKFGSKEEQDAIDDYCRYIFRLTYLWEKLGTPPQAGGLNDQDPVELFLITTVLATRDRCESTRIEAMQKQDAMRKQLGT
jgi:hypothetical protein